MKLISTTSALFVLACFMTAAPRVQALPVASDLDTPVTLDNTLLGGDTDAVPLIRRATVATTGTEQVGTTPERVKQFGERIVTIVDALLDLHSDIQQMLK